MHTAFGKAHGFQDIQSYTDFAEKVPLTDYDALLPWIDRIRQGEQCVLTNEPVTHLVPTSGTTGARKLIPFTKGLQREFNAAIGPWLIDLQSQAPGLLGGPAYWSITPAIRPKQAETSVVPIGFEADTAYLGGIRKKLVDAVMAVGSWVQHADSIEAFRYITLLALLRCPELRLISIWHPSFLSLLLDGLPSQWETLLTDLEQGTCKYAEALPPEMRRACFSHPLPKHARDLRRTNPLCPREIWPKLCVISCWANGASELAAKELGKRFPGLLLQPKGLIASEAFVTLPFGSYQPLAIHSHFFEFIDADGRILLVDTLKEGETYEVVVTTAGGLWRYRLGDRVQVSGFVGKTPSLRFLGRSGNISDRFGEKLSEAFVAQAIHECFDEHTLPRFVLLAPEEDAHGCRYTIYVEGVIQTNQVEKLEHLLRQNPHYAYCRDLGQLLSLRAFIINKNGYELYVERLAAPGARLGDIKPVILSSLSGWQNVFPGAHIEALSNVDASK
ncbi:GH3 auxin-responsive promoter [Pedosphaera parvula Ellin514]|uniref:GH3 auxin-responsive promoter n=2 Tax=Pedosphaera TaxID=1032526 RepID=B9XDZ7_PEDPL|nr:GH3 auxin-responsive promoter [Pedosphaera parvula Ellin514]